jgi:hypothetical protein
LTPKEIKDNIKEIVAKLGSPQGGLVLRAWAIPDVPLENVETFCTAAEQYCYAK